MPDARSNHDINENDDDEGVDVNDEISNLSNEESVARVEISNVSDKESITMVDENTDEDVRGYDGIS